MIRRIEWRAIVGLGLAIAAPAVEPAGAQQLAPAQVAELKSQVRASGGRVIVQVRPSQGARLRADGRSNMSDQAVGAIQANLERRGLRNARRIQLLPVVFGDATDADIDALLADPNVVTIEPDVLMPLADWRPASFTEIAARAAETVPWGITRVTAPQAWELRTPALLGTGVKVAFLDSGGDVHHPDLAWAGGYNAVIGSTAPSAWHDDLTVCGGHGTHVAGTIGALQNTQGVVGVAPGVSLYAIKVFENVNGSCLAYVSKQIAGLNWAVQQGVRVVSVSIGGSTHVASYEQAVAAASAAGTYVVAAAGNNGSTAITYPANYPDALAIAALTSSNTRSSYSNYGPKIFIAAPGDAIQSTLPGGGYGGKSGTSMATPHVAGVIALLLAHDPGASRSTILGRLAAGALDIGPAGRDDQTGHGLVRAYESIAGVGAPPPPPPPPPPAPVPLALAVSPTSRKATVVKGSSAVADSGTVTVTGTGSATTGWTATKRKSWTTLLAGSGTGNGKVRWNRNLSGLSAGTYVDTITVTVAGATGSPARIIDTLVVTPAPVALALSVSPTSRKVTVVAGSSAVADSGTVTVTGTGSATTGWTATKRKSWTTLSTASGTGNGKVRWNRNPSGLSAGTYVDTITVTVAGATGSPARIIDTLVVTPAPVALALSVSPTSRKATVVAGSSTVADSGTVTVTGTGSATTGWTATKRKSWTTLSAASGTGNGKVRWNRNPSGLSAGTYVDTITVTVAGATGSPARIIDTLVVTPAPVALALAVSPTSRKATVVAGSSAVADSGTVTVTGTGSATTGWTATKRKSWTTLSTASGTGNGKVRWNRNPSGLSAGTYVDTITVTVAGATGSPARIIDTLVVTAAPPPPPPPPPPAPLTLAVSPASRKASVTAGTKGPIADSGTVTVTGTGSATTGWTATKRKSWTTLSTTSGIGSGRVRWNRNPSGLSAGTYVDTITVTVAGATGSPARIIDTLVITPKNNGKGPPATVPNNGKSTSVSSSTGNLAAVVFDSVGIVLGGAELHEFTWTASVNVPWIHLLRSGGSGTDPVSWLRNADALPPGVHVGRIAIRIEADDEFFDLVFADTVVAGVEDPQIDQAGVELFEPNRLSANQRMLLDQLGNRNGVYDVGDFLAWVERTGSVLAPALMQRVLSLPVADGRSRPPPRNQDD